MEHSRYTATCFVIYGLDPWIQDARAAMGLSDWRHVIGRN